MAFLESIKSPADVKSLSTEELTELAGEIRTRIIEVTSKNGGHIGPNLGVVELTLALHRVFESPRDQFVFDVSHQGYVHKLLTGRQGRKFDKLRKSGGVSGFLNRSESEHDCYGAGHAGTALSAALGMAVARDLRGGDEHVVAVIGDAALTCGITMEALNNAAAQTKRLVVVLNDNKWSISKSVGAMAKYLNELITNPLYNRLHDDLESILHKIPGGDSIIRIGSKAKKEAKDFIVPSCLFEKYGLRYIGPIDGHDLELVTQYLNFCKNFDEPIVLHILTTKGKGYDIALEHPEKFHGTSPFSIATGKGAPKKPGTPPNYQDVFGKAMVRFAKNDSRVVGITGAMSTGTGLIHMREEIPEKFFDVGIAEEHAILFAAGMAVKGYKPVAAIYSTFLQRAYDPIIHDVCLQNLPVVFCMDRAGLSPNDGPTHHGLFDIAYLRCVPNAIVMQPKDEDELVDMLWTALQMRSPAFIRYPRGAGQGVPIKKRPARLAMGRAEVLREGDDIIIWALGPWVSEALDLAERLKVEEGLSAGVVNARFVKPLDKALLKTQGNNCKLIVTLEDNVVQGGFGSAVLEELNLADCSINVHRVGWPDKFVDHGTSVGGLRAANGLDPETIYGGILRKWRQIQSGSRAKPAWQIK